MSAFRTLSLAAALSVAVSFSLGVTIVVPGRHVDAPALVTILDSVQQDTAGMLNIQAHLLGYEMMCIESNCTALTGMTVGAAAAAIHASNSFASDTNATMILNTAAANIRPQCLQYGLFIPTSTCLRNKLVAAAAQLNASYSRTVRAVCALAAIDDPAVTNDTCAQYVKDVSIFACSDCTSGGGDDHGHLSGGAVAGIVITVIAAAMALSLLCCYVFAYPVFLTVSLTCLLSMEVITPPACRTCCRKSNASFSSGDQQGATFSMNNNRGSAIPPRSPQRYAIGPAPANQWPPHGAVNLRMPVPPHRSTSLRASAYRGPVYSSQQLRYASNSAIPHNRNHTPESKLAPPPAGAGFGRNQHRGSQSQRNYSPR